LPHGRPTQADVARAAGVSQTTVSIVLNHVDTGTVRLADSTRARVLEALDATGYTVNPIARSLAGHRTNIFGVFGFEPVFGSDSASFYLPFMEGIEQAAELAARDLLLFTSAARDGLRHHIYRQNENRLRLVDACILIGNGEPQMELSRLASEGYPFVFVGRREIPGVEVPYVTADYAAATQRVVERLAALGHTDLAYLAKGGRAPSSLERQQAAQESARHLGIRARVIEDAGAVDFESVMRAIEDGATALLVEPLVDVEHLADVLDAYGFHFPSHVSVVMLGEPVNTTRHPHYWSGYRIPRREMGRQAVEMLIAMLETQAKVDRTRVIPCIDQDGRTAGPPRTALGAGA
jgi:LacI family transcriptional regulator